MLPANASQKLIANSYKEGRNGEGREGGMHDSCNLVTCETRLLVYIKKMWIFGLVVKTFPQLSQSIIIYKNASPCV